MASLTKSLREDVRRVLLSPEEAVALEVRGRTDAAVLVPLYVQDGDLHAWDTTGKRPPRRNAQESLRGDTCSSNG